MKRKELVPQGCGITRREFMGGAVLLGAVATARGREGLLAASALDHVNIRVADVHRSVEFYAKLFGVKVSKNPHAPANPGSVRTELWFVNLGASYLAISPLSPPEKPGIDHFCFAIRGFNAESMKPKLAGLNQPWPDSRRSDLWIRDPDSHIIQMSGGGSPEIVGGAVLVEPLEGVIRRPAFEAMRITHLRLAVSDVGKAATYYEKLLGDEARGPESGKFEVGRSVLELGKASGGEYFRVGVAEFDSAAALPKLKSLGVVAHGVRNKSAIAFHDPDGLKVEIGA